MTQGSLFKCILLFLKLRVLKVPLVVIAHMDWGDGDGDRGMVLLGKKSISHLGKRNIIFTSHLGRDMLVSRRVIL